MPQLCAKGRKKHTSSCLPAGSGRAPQAVIVVSIGTGGVGPSPVGDAAGRVAFLACLFIVFDFCKLCECIAHSKSKK